MNRARAPRRAARATHPFRVERLGYCFGRRSRVEVLEDPPHILRLGSVNLALAARLAFGGWNDPVP